MNLSERIIWALFGCAIGFILGYIVRYLHDIKEELDEVDNLVKGKPPEPDLHERDERGFVRFPIIMDVALLLVIVLTVWAAFQSQAASNNVQDTQDKLTRVTLCNQQYLSKTIEALNERTTYTVQQANANVDLQKAQTRFLSVVIQTHPPRTPEERAQALRHYFSALNEFIKINQNAVNKVVQNPYPTTSELSSCLGD